MARKTTVKHYSYIGTVEER